MQTVFGFVCEAKAMTIVKIHIIVILYFLTF